MNQTLSYTYVYKTNGFYLGFISGGNLFSRDGVYLGWVEENFVWDAQGQFRGELSVLGDNYYILKNMFAVPPIPKIPKPSSSVPILPNPPANIAPVIIPQVGVQDGF
jgi:hypothetical protein